LEQIFTDNIVSCLSLARAKAQTELKSAEIEKKLLEAQLTLAQNPNYPHIRYGAHLKHDGLEWIATFGYTEDGKPTLVARGDTPAKALLDFDHKWYGLETPE
jgi:hypothetical protein